MPTRVCAVCQRRRNTQFVLFKMNASFMVWRTHAEKFGHLCLGCTTKTFFSYELLTLFGTWFGVIGAFVGPVYLFHNIVEYVDALIRFMLKK